MKKITVFIVLLAMLTALTGCGSHPSLTTTTSEVADSCYIEDGLDIHIVKSGAHLADMKIQGDLYIDESVGEGDYTLDNIVISGDLVIHGSGQYSGHLINVQGKRLVISSLTNPRVVLDMDTRFEGVQIASNCIVESQADGIGEVTVKSSKTQDAINVMLKGQFPEVTLESTAQVTLDGGISLMHVLQNAGMTEINMIDTSKMYFFSTYGQSVTISGGTIIEAWINAEYCSLPETVGKIASEVGVADVTIGDVSYALPQNPAPSPDGENADDPNPSGILLDGYPQVSSTGMRISIAAAAYEQCTLYALVEAPDVAALETTPEHVRDGISQGAGTSMPDGGAYVVIHRSFSISSILKENVHVIDLSDSFSSDGSPDSDRPEFEESNAVVLIVIEDSDGCLSPIHKID